MKNPLSYQVTEYDCGPTSMINAINYLFAREDIYPDVVKCIMQYCLDNYNEKGEIYKNAPKKMNRKISYDVLNSQSKGFYAMGELNERESVLINNTEISDRLKDLSFVI